ncbi:2-hydroxyacyl-CoA dehydratase [Vreelandella populi]|uniref:2-hydroxyacyl-CoA dehydratase n=1 Tax=Vreelandella populi TaxID=2498858 RepID=UPI000F8EBA2D|nr:2-hydroxyacyl-CoA dehydratase [Halomonas populi]RUR55769.1 2-hydroxyacyl-CoA dehydratase [Halomonas populi]
MRYNKVKDLIEWAEGFHKRMAQQYSEAADKTDNERLQMALTYLASQEIQMQKGLNGLFHDGTDHKEVLETWFDESSDFPEPPELEQMAEKSVEGSVDEITRAAVETHTRLQKFYEHRALRSRIEPEATFFNSLAEGHEAQTRKLVTSMQEFEDI